jgi:hypothetical protein
MNIFLLGLKILGIVISGASIIGVERLKIAENKIRNFLEKKNIDILFNKTYRLLIHPINSFLTTQKEIQHKISHTLANNTSSVNATLRSIGHSLGKIFQPPKNSGCLGLLTSIILIVAQFILMNFYSFIYSVTIFLALSLHVIFTLLLLVFFIVTWLFSLLATGFIMVVIWLLKSITWAITRPYIWLDIEVQKRKIESTIVVIGIFIAIVAEILGNYYN